MEELERAMNKIKTSNKCFDGDNIHPLYLKHSGTKFKQKLLTLANRCLQTQTWPWNRANVKMLKKPNKESYQKPGSYRPISITSYIGKIMENPDQGPK